MPTLPSSWSEFFRLPTRARGAIAEAGVPEFVGPPRPDAVPQARSAISDALDLAPPAAGTAAVMGGLAAMSPDQAEAAPRGDWRMSLTADQGAYRGDYPDEQWPPSPVPYGPQDNPWERGVQVAERGLPRASPDRSYPRDVPAWLSETGGRIAGLPKHLGVGAVRGAADFTGSYVSPMEELTGAANYESRQAQAEGIRNQVAHISAEGPMEEFAQSVGHPFGNPLNWYGGSLPSNLGWTALSGAGGYFGRKALEDRGWGRAGEVMGSLFPLVTERALSGVGQRFIPTGTGTFSKRIQPQPEQLAPNPRVRMGGNEPPPEFKFTPEELANATGPGPRMGSVADQSVPPPPPSWAAGLPRPRPAANSTAIPDIRDLSVPDAIAIARTQPHLIKSGDQSEGYYVGAPRDIQSKRDLNAQRKFFDEYVAADPRGGDWYDRYRNALNLSTGGIPLQNEWSAAQHGQWSAGVDPSSELHFVLKEGNAAIAGMPTKAARPAQHEAHMEAIRTGSTEPYQLGKKTGEYADQIDPAQLTAIPGATGVNDFRFARSWGYTEPSGEPQKGALTDASHRFVDMETALAVDRANQANLGGRSDWTGEQLQAAPWVRQKALDLMSRNADLTYEEAYVRAMRTIGEYYPSKTYNATHEAQPGADVTGHMMGSVAADNTARQAYFDDPRSRWSTAPLPEGVSGPGRDAIYAGLGNEGTGNFMRVLPSRPMMGSYTRPDGVTEINPGEVAQPMGTFQRPREYDKEFVGPRLSEPFKQATAADRALMSGGEAFRAYVDAQNAGSWHKVWEGGPVNQSNSLYYPGAGKADPALLQALRSRNAQYGLPDAVDTGQGAISTQWWPQPAGGKAFDKALREGDMAGPGGEVPRRVRLDSDLIDYVGKWDREGSGEASRHMLNYITKTPELRAAFNNNPYIADRALAKFERDKDWADRWGAPRQDIQNARAIIGAGPGWIDRMEKALKDGSISLPAFAALMAGTAAMSRGASNDKM